MRAEVPHCMFPTSGFFICEGHLVEVKFLFEVISQPCFIWKYMTRIFKQHTAGHLITEPLGIDVMTSLNRAGMNMFAYKEWHLIKVLNVHSTPK